MLVAKTSSRFFYKIRRVQFDEFYATVYSGISSLFINLNKESISKQYLQKILNLEDGYHNVFINTYGSNSTFKVEDISTYKKGGHCYHQSVTNKNIGNDHIQQNAITYELRDDIFSIISKKVLIFLLEYEEQGEAATWKLLSESEK